MFACSNGTRSTIVWDGSLAITSLALMWSLLVVIPHTRIEIDPQLLQCPIDLLLEHDQIDLIQHGLMEPSADPVGLGMSCLRACVIDVFAARYSSYSCRSGAPQYSVPRSVRMRDSSTHPFRSSAALTGVFRSYTLANPTLLYLSVNIC